ncbi:efflux RND transporter periplasmic adaptor subunit [Candidatus Latescibacterota bacterium]
MKKLIIFIFIAVALGAVVLFVIAKSSGNDEVQYTEISVERGNLTEMALAVGKIDPDHEIVIKSQVSGIVEKIHREVGELITQGDPLMVVKPKPTPLELAEAQRQLELVRLNSKYLQNELVRSTALYKENYISGKDYENAQKVLQEAEVREKQALERLELMEKGSSQIGDVLIESVIRAPTSGMILERLVNEGDPVVPLTSYQPGTALMRVADMDDLIFIGTVDEIDVGKIKTGMRAEIHVGALPEDTLQGELYFISPKSRTKDNVIVFDIKIQIIETNDVTLRAGYSASADLIITEKQDALYIPERLVTFSNDSTFVKIKDSVTDSLYTQFVEIGFSDGISIEILDGLADGDIVIEQN